MKNRSFNPSRLDLARKRRGKKKATLAAEVSVSPRMLTSYETGEKEPSSLTLARLASILDFPEVFFFGEDLDEPSPEGSSFRALSTLTARQRDQALAAGALAFSLSDWITQRFETPLIDIPRYQGIDPETAADSIRAEWGLGEKPIKQLLKLLEKHGVRIFSLAEDCVEMDAFSIWRRGAPYMFLNLMKSSEHSRMDAAHELGHLVLHWKGGVRGRQAETEAQRFAAAFLMPKPSVLAYAPRGGSLTALIKAKRYWRVSLSALVYRMHTIRLISDWEYRSLFVKISEAGYRKKEPQSAAPEASVVLDQVFRSLRDNGVSGSQVASSLGIHQDELNKMIFGLVLTSIAGGKNDSDRSISRREPGQKTVLRLV